MGQLSEWHEIQKITKDLPITETQLRFALQLIDIECISESFLTKCLLCDIILFCGITQLPYIPLPMVEERPADRTLLLVSVTKTKKNLV